MCLLPSLKWSSTVSSLGIVQWDFTRRDHPGNPGRVSGSGPVTFSTFVFLIFHVNPVFVSDMLDSSRPHVFGDINIEGCF